MELLTKTEFMEELASLETLISGNYLCSPTSSYSSPKFGEVWICELPVLVLTGEKVSYEIVSRPVLIIDDGSEYFVRHDHKNYYGLKITSQKDSYQRRKIHDYHSLGLQKESFVRIEIPLKIEREQFQYRIGVMAKNEAMKYLLCVQKLLKQR